MLPAFEKVVPRAEVPSTDLTSQPGYNRCLTELPSDADQRRLPDAPPDLSFMRLTPDQRERIVRIICESAGDDAAVWVYGSRIQDDRRGGDVDLLVRPSHAIDLKQQAMLHARLEEELRLPVDISFIDPQRGMTRFQKLAAAEALPLEMAR